MRCDSITEAIGQTPLLRLPAEVHGLAHIDLYAKLELLNPFASVKDRAAWSMIKSRVEEAQRVGSTLVELSSGNTAKALAALAGMHGLRFTSVTNRMKVPEIKELLLLLGATIEELPGQAECLDPTNTEDPLTKIHRRIGAAGSAYLHTDQYFNEANTRIHEEGTGPEIIADLDGVAPDHFVACVGTAGSSTGVARALRAHHQRVTVVGLVAAKSDFIPGIRTIDEVHEVGLFDPATYDTIEEVSAEDAIDGLLVLNRRCGVLAGPTGGAAYVGAIRHLRTIDAELAARAAAGPTPVRQSAVFIVCDRVESYLSYIRTRRPEVFNQPEASSKPGAIGADELARVPSLGVEEAVSWIEAARPLIIDLRGSFAYATARIAGSINLVDELFGELLRAGLPVEVDRPVLLVCPIGEKSRTYAARLARLGHRSARSLDGGMVAWRDAGAAMVRGQVQPGPAEGESADG